jgi:hypothetical protein
MADSRGLGCDATWRKRPNAKKLGLARYGSRQAARFFLISIGCEANMEVTTYRRSFAAMETPWRKAREHAQLGKWTNSPTFTNRSFEL